MGPSQGGFGVGQYAHYNSRRYRSRRRAFLGHPGHGSRLFPGSSVGRKLARRGAAAAYFLYPYLLPYAKNYTSSDTVAMIGSAGVVFLIALIIVSFITMRIADFIIDSRIGALDRTLGFLFGAARGVLLVVVAMLFFNWLVAPQQQPVWVTTAKSKPLLDNLGGKLIALLPENADATILDRLRGKDTTGEGENEGTGGTTTQPPAEETPATNGAATNG